MKKKIARRRRRRKTKRRYRKRRKTRRRRRRKHRGGYRLRFPQAESPTWKLTDLPEYNKLNNNEKLYTFGKGDFHDMVAYLNQYGITSPVTQQYILNNLIPLGVTRLEFLPRLITPTIVRDPVLDEEDKSNFINAIADAGELPILEDPT